MNNRRYRVILTGERANGVDREQALSSLARMLQTSAANLVQVVDGGEHAIENLLDAHAASALQKRLERIGLRSRIDLASNTQTAPGRVLLRLPEQAELDDAGLMHCPACGHAQLVARSCEECGVVFADYNRQRKGGFGGGQTLAPLPSRPPRPGRTSRSAPANPRRDVHADAYADWREQWLDEEEVPTEQYHVNLFMGPKSAELSSACVRMMAGRHTRWVPQWAGAAMISPFLWAMYRKMWGWAVLIFVLEALLPLILLTVGGRPGLPAWLDTLGLGLIVANRLFWPAVLKTLYCRHVRRTIEYMHRLAPTFAPDIDIATRGGTSKTSVFAGVVLAMVISLLAWHLLDSLYLQLYGRPYDLASEVRALERGSVTEGTSEPAEAASAVDENEWVQTRNKLRVLGQAINVWLEAPETDVDPESLVLSEIALALELEPENLLDAWGHQIMYAYGEQAYRLVSPGPDGTFGNDDDVEYRRMLGR